MFIRDSVMAGVGLIDADSSIASAVLSSSSNRSIRFWSDVLSGQGLFSHHAIAVFEAAPSDQPTADNEAAVGTRSLRAWRTAPSRVLSTDLAFIDHRSITASSGFTRSSRSIWPTPPL